MQSTLLFYLGEKERCQHRPPADFMAAEKGAFNVIYQIVKEILEDPALDGIPRPKAKHGMDNGVLELQATTSFRKENRNQEAKALASRPARWKSTRKLRGASAGNRPARVDT